MFRINEIGREDGFSYDSEGKHVKKVTATEITVFVYSADKLVAEYSTELPQNPTTSYVATDTLQSVRAISDKNGNIISRRDFMPFGEELYANTANRTTSAKYSAAGDDGIRQKFTGYEKDKETGLDFAEARYYNNAHGRFTAVDPLLASGKSANPQTFNRYVYVMNSPLILTDPTGLFGDYYDSKTWKYLGSDGEKDGKVYSAEVVRYHNDGSGKVDIKNWHLITVGPMAPPRSPDRFQALLNGFGQGIDNMKEAAGTGALNAPISFANSITERLTFSTLDLPVPTLTYKHNLWNNPFYISPFPYSNQRAAQLGSAVTMGLSLSPAIVFGVFQGNPLITGLTNEFRDFRRAEFARDALANKMGKEKGAYTAGYNSAGQVACGYSSAFGCAEDMVRYKLGPDVKFTEAVRWKRNKETGKLELVQQPICEWCQLKYNRNQFPPSPPLDYKRGFYWDDQQ